MPATHDIGTVRRFSVRVTVALIVSVMVIAIFVLYAASPNLRGLVAFAAALVGGGATVYAAYYAASTLKINVVRDMQARSFAVLQTLNEHHPAEVRVFLEKEVIDKNLAAEQLYKKIVEDPKRLSAVSAVLGGYEDISIAIQEGFADEKCLYRSLSFLIPWTFHNLRAYVDEGRRISHNRGLYIEMERLSDSWKAGLFLSTGDVIPEEIQMRDG